MKKIFFVISFIFSSITFAQNKIEGTLIDQSNNKLAFISIVASNEKESKFTNSDENGKFSFQNLSSSQYTLKISSVGYKTLQKNIDFTNSNYIQLNSITLLEDTKVLKTVELRAKTTSIKQEIDRLVINVGKDLTATGTDAASVLNNIQSVSVDSESGEISLRGNTNVTVLIDSKPSNIPVEQLLKQIPANAIKNIELITNPSAKYNPEGNSGIINIELVKNVQLGFNGSYNANISYARNLTYGTGFNFNLKRKNINWFANYSYNGGKSDVIGKLYRSNSFQDIYGLDDKSNHLLKAGADVDVTEKLSFSLSTTQAYNALDYNNNTVVYEIPSFSLTNNSNYNFIRNANTPTYDLLVHQNFTKKKHFIEFNTSFSERFQPENSVWTNSVDPLDLTNNYTEDINFYRNRWYNNLDYSLPINDNITFEAGLESRNYNITNQNNTNQQVLDSNNNLVTKGLSDFNFERDIYTAYFNYRHKINKLGLQTGLRAEQLYITGNFKQDVDNQNSNIRQKTFSLYPSLFTTYDFNKNHQLQFSYSRRVDRPSIKQINPIRSWGTPLLTSVGNPDLKQQFTNSYELKYNVKIDKNDFSFTTFYRDINDFISRTLTVDTQITDRLILSYDNFEKTNNYGFEFATYLKIKPWWKINASSDVYFQEQQGIINNVISSVENVQWNGRINNNISVNAKLNLQLNGLYRGREKTLQRDREAMYMVSIASSYKVFKDNGTITLGINDLTNNFWPKFNTFNPINQQGSFNHESRKVTLGFTYNFGEKSKGEKKKKNNSEEENGMGSEGM